MSDMTTANDCYLTAKARVQKWYGEFMLRWYAPMMDVIVETAMQGARTSPQINRQKLEQDLSPGARARLRGR